MSVLPQVPVMTMSEALGNPFGRNLCYCKTAVHDSNNEYRTIRPAVSVSILNYSMYPKCSRHRNVAPKLLFARGFMMLLVLTLVL